MRALKIIGKILLHILSVLLCIVLFASTLVTMLVADVKVATNKDNLHRVISSTLSAPHSQPLGPITAAVGDDLSAANSGGDLSGQIVEFAYGMLEEQSGGELPFTIDEVKSFVEESTIKDFIAEKSASIISDIYTGENTTDITSDEIQQLLTENKDLIQEYFKVELDDESIQTVAQSISEMPAMQQIREEGIANMLTGGTSSEDTDADEGVGTTTGTSSSNSMADMLDMVRTYTSDTVLLACIGVCAVLVALLFLCAWSKPYSAMFYSGSTFTLAGLVFLVPTLIAWLAVDTWMNLFSGMPMVGPLSRMILMLTGGVCGCVFGLGVLLIAGGIVVKILIRKKKAAKAACAEATVVEAAEETAQAPAEVEAAAEEVTEEAPTAEEAPTEESVETAPAAE